MRGTPPESAPGWHVFHGTGALPDGGPVPLPEAPPWRRFRGEPVLTPPEDDEEATRRRLGQVEPVSQLDATSIEMVNAALLLRRPLLLTGPPGVGKSTLAFLVAREMGLGRVLVWSIVSRTNLRDGLYAYDALGRAQAIAAWRAAGPDSPGTDGVERGADGQPLPSLGDFITLGPLGTALLPYERPRVLLIDELDKSDLDLPNDLLHVLENGSYEVPELVRDSHDSMAVHTSDPDRRASVRNGRVECREFPVVVITSNGEREFPAAFRRRCLPLEMTTPSREKLLAIVSNHFRSLPPDAEPLVDLFLERVRSGGTHSLDQLFNAVQLTTAGGLRDDGSSRRLLEMLLRDLSTGR
ncbi:AAA family ATPase [Streptomyces sp. NPDC126510]|uniref:AAA family ATPase n=1 Tax=Streptomyces sp. NPDC126510 TaxID=3155317 RepID=UPI00331E291B